MRRMYQRLRIILDTPNGLLGDVGHVEYRFGPFGDSVSVDERYVQEFLSIKICMRPQACLLESLGAELKRACLTASNQFEFEMNTISGIYVGQYIYIPYK